MLTPINEQLTRLFILAMVVACIAWTVTKEEIFKVPRDYCIRRSKESSSIFLRKFFYLFTCEFCFSHYVAIIFICLADYKLLLNNWKGYLIAGFSLVWLANFYMSLYSFIRQDIKKIRKEIENIEKKD